MTRGRKLCCLNNSKTTPAALLSFSCFNKYGNNFFLNSMRKVYFQEKLEMLIITREVYFL